LPGHGISVVVGLILVFVGIWYAIGGGSGTGSAWTALISIGVMLGTLAAFFIYFTRVWRGKYGLTMQQRPSAGYVASADYTLLLGLRGEAVSPLRPSGSAEIDGVRYNVVTDGSFIQPGTPFEVVQVQGSRIVVRELETPKAAENQEKVI
jgi:membrane-bound serine protease (ClpP class)